MQSFRLFVQLGAIPAFMLVICNASAQQAAFAIAATNVTMPSVAVTTDSNGDTDIHLGVSQFTVTGIPGSGTLTIGCQYSGPVTEANIPRQCGVVGPGQFPVPAGEAALNGVIYFVPDGLITPGLAQLHNVPHPTGHLSAASAALPGALMLGFGWGRRVRRRFALAVLAVGTLVGLTGIGGCGASFILTPGNFPYTISAEFQETGTNVLQSATTSVIVTLP
jgi:hypothetical protein